MKSLRDFWPLIVGLIGAGMWLGALQQRVANLEQREHYIHGDFAVPKESK